MIDELIDYIRLRYIGDITKFSFVTEHPFHSFDSKYFDDTLHQVYTYLGKNDAESVANVFMDTIPPVTKLEWSNSNLQIYKLYKRPI